jgi:hypothetical protein
MMKRIASLLLAAALMLAPAGAMNNPGIILLGDFIVGGPGTQCTPLVNGVAGITNLQALTALSLQVRFAYGSGGTKTNVYVQTSIDQGTSWFDILNVAFTTASGVEEVNLSGLNSLTTPTAPANLSLADNTTLNGPLGDRLQACVVSTGTYGGQTLVSVRGMAR